MGNSISVEDLQSASDAQLQQVVEVSQAECEVLLGHIADLDASNVHAATKGVGTNEAALIGILCNRTKSQLDRLDLVVHKKFERSLLDIVRKDVSGDFGRMITHALLPIPEFGEAILSAATDGVGCNESMLVDLAMTKSNAELAAIKRQFEAKTGKALIDILKDELKGTFEKLMVKLYLGERSEDSSVDEARAAQQAKQLHDAGIGKRMGTDEKTFLEILLGNGRPQVQAIKAAYEKNHSMSLQRAIEKEFSGDTKRGMLALLHASPESYTAYALNQAFEGIGTDDRRVCYLLGGTDKRLLPAVCDWFLNAYGTSLREALLDELSGDFEDAAIAWIAGADPTGGMEFAVAAGGGVTALRARAQAVLQQRENLKDFVCRMDAQQIRAACKGMGTNDAKLIGIVCGRTKEHLKRVDRYYHSLFEKSLLEAIEAECSGDYKRLLCYAVMPEDDFDALMLKEACDGLGTDEMLILESLACRSGPRIAAGRAKHDMRYGRPLIDRLNSELSGDIKRIVMELIKAERSEAPANFGLADEQADELHAAGVGRGGTDETAFIRIMTQSSFPQIQAIKAAYERRHGMSLERAIGKETSGKFEDALIALTQTPEDYYSARLKKAFDGAGTDERSVSRILGGHNKHEIARIGERYLERYGQSLLEAVKRETSGRFRLACVTWLVTEDPLAGASRLEDALAELPKEVSPPEPAQADPEPLFVATPYVAPEPATAADDDGNDSDSSGDSDLSDDAKAAVAAMPGTPQQRQQLNRLLRRRKKAMRAGNQPKVARIGNKIRALKRAMAGQPPRQPRPGPAYAPPPPQVVVFYAQPPGHHGPPNGPPGYGHGPPHGPPGGHHGGGGPGRF